MLALDAAAAATAAALRCRSSCGCHWSWRCVLLLCECERILDLLCSGGGVSHACFLGNLRWRRCSILRCCWRGCCGRRSPEVVCQRSAGTLLRLGGGLQQTTQKAAEQERCRAIRAMLEWGSSLSSDSARSQLPRSYPAACMLALTLLFAGAGRGKSEIDRSRGRSSGNSGRRDLRRRIARLKGAGSGKMKPAPCRNARNAQERSRFLLRRLNSAKDCWPIQSQNRKTTTNFPSIVR